MTDNEIRGYILQYFYNKRREGHITPPQPTDFNNKININEIWDIIDQLREYKLIA